MPIYLITDTAEPKRRVMVEAVRPQTALQALIASRFDVSSALDAGDALRFAIKEGIEFLEAPGDEADPQQEPAGRPPLDAFTDAEPLPDDAPEFAEVDEERFDPDIGREDRDERRALAEEAEANYQALR